MICFQQLVMASQKGGALGSLLTYTSYDPDPTWASVRAFAMNNGSHASTGSCRSSLSSHDFFFFRPSFCLPSWLSERTVRSKGG